jgi:hypothetical protein
MNPVPRARSRIVGFSVSDHFRPENDKLTALHVSSREKMIFISRKFFTVLLTVWNLNLMVALDVHEPNRNSAVLCARQTWGLHVVLNRKATTNAQSWQR